VPEEQPVQLASTAGVSVYQGGGNVFNDVVSTDFLTRAAGYTGLGNGILADLGPYTGGTDSLFSGAVAGLSPELLAGGNTGVVPTNLYGGQGSNLAGLVENDPFPTTALFEGFDPLMDLSSMYA
jgi:hypothetical protein